MMILRSSFHVDEIFATATDSGYLSRSQRQMLRFAIERQALSPEEAPIVDRLLYAVRRGWLRLAE